MDILGGDLTVALGTRTPAGGVVITPLSPIGQHHSEAGTVGVSTAIGLWQKLRRIAEDSRVALLYHTREHGLAGSRHLVLVQGRATFPDRPEGFWTPEIERSWDRHLVPRKRGRFWDWRGREYYDLRVPITVEVHRLVTWTRRDGAGEPAVIGVPLPVDEPASQPPPEKGRGPRVPARRYRRRLDKSRHTLLGFVGADGFPYLCPVDIAPEDDLLEIVGTALPNGDRRAGILAHWFEAKLKGQGQAVMTGWLEAEDGLGRYAPHTVTGYTMPRLGDTAFAVATGLGGPPSTGRERGTHKRRRIPKIVGGAREMRGPYASPDFLPLTSGAAVWADKTGGVAKRPTAASKR